MKKINKMILNLYSLIILIISITTTLLIFKWVDYEFIGQAVKTILEGYITSKVILGINVLFILLSIKCMFFEAESEEENESNGIQLQNSNGRLVISRDTIENVVLTVVRSFDAVGKVETEVEEDKENQLIVAIEMTVGNNAIIKELSTNVQTKVKEAIKTTLDLETKEINIRINNIENIVKE